jgi:hypothetical protein
MESLIKERKNSVSGLRYKADSLGHYRYGWSPPPDIRTKHKTGCMELTLHKFSYGGMITFFPAFRNFVLVVYKHVKVKLSP